METALSIIAIVISVLSGCFTIYEYDAALEVIEGNDSFNDFEGDDEDDFNDEE